MLAKAFHGRGLATWVLPFVNLNRSLGDKILSWERHHFPGSPRTFGWGKRDGAGGGGDQAGGHQVLRTRWGAQALGLRFLGGDMDGGHWESRRSLAG